MSLTNGLIEKLTDVDKVVKYWLDRYPPINVDEPGTVWSECVKDLTIIVSKHLGSDWSVQPFGSAANGFGNTKSDMDLTTVREGCTTSGPREQQQSLLMRVKPAFQSEDEAGKFKLVHTITGARVPILKLRYDDQLDVDLSFNNQDAFSNTRLLKAYTTLAPAVRGLGFAIKMWSHEVAVSGAWEGNLSSYALTLMALYFLLVEESVKMPHLNTEDYKTPDASPQQPWECKDPVSVLLYKFFYFYTHTFNWGTEVVSVRLGRRAPLWDLEFQQLPGSSRYDQRSQRLHVEDPFFLNINLNRVLEAHREVELRKKIGEALDTLKEGTVPAGLAPRSSACALAWLGDAKDEKTQSLGETGTLAASPQLLTNGTPYKKVWNRARAMREEATTSKVASSAPVEPLIQSRRCTWQDLCYERTCIPCPMVRDERAGLRWKCKGPACPYHHLDEPLKQFQFTEQTSGEARENRMLWGAICSLFGQGKVGQPLTYEELLQAHARAFESSARSHQGAALVWQPTPYFPVYG